jgi:hypothetical protein
MRVVGKFKGEDIWLDSFHMSRTYGGFLLGPSEKRMRESNMRILDNLRGRECDRLFGEGRPSFIYGEDKLNLDKRLPGVFALAWLSCAALVDDDQGDLSQLVLIWLQNADEDPFRKLSEIVPLVDWEQNAQNCWF